MQGSAATIQNFTSTLQTDHSPLKRISAFIAATFISLSMSAFSGPSKVSVSAIGNAPIRIMIDGNSINSGNKKTTVTDMNVGYHTIKIYQQKKVGRKKPFNNYQLIYNATIYVKPQYHVDIMINRFGKAFMDEQPMAANYYDSDDWDNYDNDNTNGYYGNQAMSTTSFEQFKQSLHNTPFENTKLSISKQVISTNYFTVAQVSEILQQFNFENNKLEIAKYAYQYTLDKNNYYTLANSFAFNSSKDELIRYIQANK